MGSPRPAGETAEGPAGEASGLRVILLTPEELGVLLRCCLKQRSAIPCYLQSAKTEFDAMNSIVKKLEACAEGRD